FELRIQESKFKYVITNLIPPKKFSKKILEFDVWPKKSPNIGIIGISGKMTSDKAIENGFKSTNQIKTLKKTLLEICKRYPQVKLLIVLSHMGNAEDFQLKKTISSFWPHHSIILGGHDHNQIISYFPKSDKCMLVKGKSNGRTLQVLMLDEKTINQVKPNLQKKLVILSSKDFQKFNTSKEMELKINSWYNKLKKQNKLPSNKTIKKFPKNVILDATEISLRKGTTNFGNFVTDCLKKYTNSDIALINSGHFRSDRLFIEKLTNFDLHTTFVLEEKRNIIVTELTKKECMLFLKHAYSQEGKGKILQISKNTLEILRNTKSNQKLKVSFISDMIYTEDDGFGNILAKNRKISIVKLRKELKKDILENTNLMECVVKVAKKVSYDSKIRMSV
ncbi:MAG: 5'-nucleotidase C-terminal domain-containing protein, partial [Nitrosopumilus sp.]|nr:5'-nucleotidase C-terminal domain-containing protein [Nitrosopumilus sp.]